MPTLTQTEIDEASAAAIVAADLQDSLKRANAVRTSHLRDNLIAVTDHQLKEIDEAVRLESGMAIGQLQSEVRDLTELVSSHQELAQHQWATQYADFLESVRFIVDGQLPSGDFRFLLLPLVGTWNQSQRTNRRKKAPVEAIPRELRDLYASYLVTRVEAFLALEESQLRKISEFGVLNHDDIPYLAGRALSEQLGFTAASAAQQALVARKAKVDAEPGVISVIWTWVGWDSFSDFALDMGLIVATGGAGVVIRVGKTLFKVARNIKRIRRARRLAPLAETFEAQMKRLDRTRERIAKRYGNYPRSEAPLTKIDATYEKLRDYHDLVVENLRVLGPDVLKDQAELRNALKQSFKIARSIAESTAANELLHGLQSAGFFDYRTKEIGEISASELRLAASKLGVSGIGALENRIRDARDGVIKALVVPKVGNKKRAVIHFYLLLLTRQLAVRTLASLVPKKWSELEMRKDLVEVTIKSLIAAFEEMCIDLKIPPKLAKPVVQAFVKTVRKTFAGALSRIVAEALQ